MPDVFDSRTRSRIMSCIRSSGTKPEVKFRRALSSSGLKNYKTHYNILGKPDIVFPKRKLAIFIDGSFWHGYNWKKLGKVPPKKYWQGKIERTIKRDELITKSLKRNGWTVLRFWEHEINKNTKGCVSKVTGLVGKL